jgi:hypothetical protein
VACECGRGAAQSLRGLCFAQSTDPNGAPPACRSRTAVAPLERLKILMQVQGNQQVYRSTWQVRPPLYAASARPASRRIMGRFNRSGNCSVCAGVGKGGQRFGSATTCCAFAHTTGPGAHGTHGGHSWHVQGQRRQLCAHRSEFSCQGAERWSDTNPYGAATAGPLHHTIMCSLVVCPTNRFTRSSSATSTSAGVWRRTAHSFLPIRHIDLWPAAKVAAGATHNIMAPVFMF